MRGLFTPPLRGGVYEVSDDGALIERLRGVGWHVGAVNLGDAREAVVVIGAELGFPDYYGKNLDALKDSLSDIDRPTALVIQVPTALAQYGQAMLDILTDRAESVRDVPFALVRMAGSASS